MRLLSGCYLFASALALPSVSLLAGTQETPPAWAEAYKKGPMDAAETRRFMKALAQYVFAHHLRKDDSPVRGMVYEYFDVTRKGQFDQFVQGEALDTMHDGAWFAAAMVNAYRATGDPFYKEILVKYQLPFYCKMLNHSDTLFRADKNDARAGGFTFNKEHALQAGEKGFVPYWWDDGGSVSLERRRDKNPLGAFACTDLFAGQANPRFLLKGYSHGSSNHLAQDLAVMLQLAWTLLNESKDEGDQKFAKEVALAARNLQESRMKHHGHIPMVDAAAAVANGDAALMKFVPDQSGPQNWQPANHYYRALYDFKPGQRYAFPGFADDQQYRYYIGLGKHGTIPKGLAFRTIYDAYTEPMLYRCYSDNAPVPPGINRFDLHPYYCKDGRLEDYRSDRKGPGGKPRPIGSRLGPQNMICCGWALQLLKEHPGIWEERARGDGKEFRVYIYDSFPGETRPQAQHRLVRFGQAGLYIESERLRLIVGGQTQEKELRLKLTMPGQKTFAVLTVTAQGVKAVNDRAEVLHAKAEGAVKDGILHFQVALPYSAAKGQIPWANGVEFGRLALQVGKEPTATSLVLAGAGEQVRHWLERELGGGLRTWEAIFKNKGYIPTGIGAGGDWDRFSDAGGYAHLISAASQWLQYLEGKHGP